MKYSDQIADWLVELGYTHCFLVGGGNIMHLIESISRKMTCIPVMHEVAAGIAAEYFNESSEKNKAFALVTAGPGLTNIITALAGAFLESRELLVIGGQAKTSDLARGVLRQRGIQEIDGVSIATPVTVCAKLIDDVVDASTFFTLVRKGIEGRKGPVFLEFPLDIQAREVTEEPIGSHASLSRNIPKVAGKDVKLIANLLNASKRPALLLGGGISRSVVKKIQNQLALLNIPIFTTWNAADRIPEVQQNYFGRPNTWGQRSSNLIIQQADLLVAMGTRLGLQQTGFNWQQFIPNGKIVQIDIDENELNKGHPLVKFPIRGDANQFLVSLLKEDLDDHKEWINYCREIRNAFPLIEGSNKTGNGYISPYSFVGDLSSLCDANDVIIPCSSGGAFTTMMQVFAQKSGQIIVTNKGLASMGYGLSGAIGAAFAHSESRVILVEGDGGFAQNMQEVGTAQINALNLKIFIFDDSGYASIRMTQKNYFGGRYVGCDTKTGLGMPNWEKLFSAWNIPVLNLKPGFQSDHNFLNSFSSAGMAVYIVPIDPEQTYFPKIMSRVSEGGTMESNPLHLMSPELTTQEISKHLKYL